ncbi:polysaccharide deacetylase family protein [Embleya sp. AB8]|uniref:polysaccharide deacetylase family protein n=1 Tax=Embleya sp. AB8 TaxID=3156304 RepID=UPI003C73F24C
MCKTLDMDTTAATSRRTLLMGAAATLGLLTVASPAAAANRQPSPRPGFVPEPVSTVDAGPQRVAVTFDDGPHPVNTPEVLRVLRRHRVRATFCVVGTEVEKYPELLEAIHDAGHLIAGHSWSHPNLQKLTPAEVTEEVERNLDAIDQVLPGLRVRWFRAPYGNWSPEVMGTLSAHGLRPLGWSVDPRDWSRPGADEIVDRVLGALTTGSIILNHDGGGNRDQTVAALEVWLPKALADGYRFVQPA